jgi:hypothetical protein
MPYLVEPAPNLQSSANVTRACSNKGCKIQGSAPADTASCGTRLLVIDHRVSIAGQDQMRRRAGVDAAWPPVQRSSFPQANDSEGRPSRIRALASDTLRPPCWRFSRADQA